MLSAAATVVLLLSRTSPQRQPLVPVPLTTYPGQEVEPSFSPDGRQVAFSWNGSNQDNFDIYIKQIGKDNPFRLTTLCRIDALGFKLIVLAGRQAGCFRVRSRRIA